MKFYSYGKQTIDESDISSVVEVLRSDWLTQGPLVLQFEEELAKKFGSRYASVVSNGTAGLHLIGTALGWGEGDIVLTTPITFVASANCAIYVGARPDFVDIDARTYTIDVEKLEHKIKMYARQGKRVKAVVAVDFAGNPCDWDGLRTLKAKYGLQLVNDFCHALGAQYHGDEHYPAKFADAVNLSFHPVKHITTGEGGAILTNDTEIEREVKILRTHGITKSAELLGKNDGPWYYEMRQLGFNYRITDFQCALGMSQLARLDEFLERRRFVARYYDAAFRGDDRFISPSVAPNCKHAYHLYPLQVRFDRIYVDKRELFERLQRRGIHLQVHYIPVHLHPYYREKYGFKPGDYPESELFYEREISIPMYPSLAVEDLEYINGMIRESVAN
ncbi:MAG: UDP-4-amino-4,6-dideoxy-N-acetyl-beta-L-altrosamine transaminase [Bacteroidetes bacterium]|nr:UDP-4-amino-4,6-dideoxy-N-acetyl-beta-L-altrosamine transaminase [Bacteroidota bacterium]